MSSARAGGFGSCKQAVGWFALFCFACAAQNRAGHEIAKPGGGQPSTMRRSAPKHGVAQRTVPPATAAQSESPDDDDDAPSAEADSLPSPLVHPLDSWSDEALRRAFHEHPETLGSISIGTPNAGRLMNGVRPPASSLYHLVDPEHAWGTQETVTSLCLALEGVARQHPNTPTVDIGHLSARHGGPLRPHRSHQSGRDVDLGLYYSSGPSRWYTRSNGDNLDAARTWTLIRILATTTDAEMLLLDITLQRRIEAFARSVEVDPAWVHELFHGSGSRSPLLRHSPGHATHIHIRFKNPIARHTAQRLAPLLAELRPTLPMRQANPSVSHVARVGDTLQKLAQRYCATMDAIRSANRMHGYQLKAGQVYVIPVQKPNSADCRQSR